MSNPKDVERARKAAAKYWSKAWGAASSDQNDLMEAAFLRVIEETRAEAETDYEAFKKSSEGNRLRLEYENRILDAEEAERALRAGVERLQKSNYALEDRVMKLRAEVERLKARDPERVYCKCACHDEPHDKEDET